MMEKNINEKKRLEHMKNLVRATLGFMGGLSFLYGIIRINEFLTMESDTFWGIVGLIAILVGLGLFIMVTKEHKPNFISQAIGKLANKVKWLPEDERLIFLMFLASIIVFTSAVILGDRITIIILFILFAIIILVVNIANKFVSKKLSELNK